MVSEEKIWEYLDGSLSEADRVEVASAIKNDSSVALLYHQISTLHHSLRTQTAEEPSMSFTENVMRAVMTSSRVTATPQIPLLPLLAAFIPFAILVVLALVVCWYSPAAGRSFGVSDHFSNILKMAFVLVDSVLLVLFAEQWFYSKKSL